MRHRKVSLAGALDALYPSESEGADKGDQGLKHRSDSVRWQRHSGQAACGSALQCLHPLQATDAN